MYDIFFNENRFVLFCDWYLNFKRAFAELRSSDKKREEKK